MRPIPILLRSFVSLLAAVGCAVRFASAQGQVGITAGGATDQRGVHASALTVAPSITFAPSGTSAFTLGVSGTQYQGGAWTVGANAALDERASLGGGAAFSLGAAGSIARASFDATFGTVEATPAIELGLGVLTLFGGAHAAAGFTTVQRPASGLPFVGVPSFATASRSFVAPVFGARLQLPGGRAEPAFDIGYREEAMNVSRVGVTDRIVSATLHTGVLTVSAAYGERAADDERRAFTNGSAEIAFSSRAALEVGGGSYPTNRLTGAAGGEFLSAGLVFRFGGPRAAAALPVPLNIAPPGAGMTRLSIRAENASRVELAGDWNGWEWQGVTRASNGVWYTDVPLGAGEYRYAFRIDGQMWRVPNGVAAVDDGFGGKSAYVVVRDGGR